MDLKDKLPAGLTHFLQSALVPLLIVLLVLNLITFILYAADKRKAQKGAWRIKEKTLLLFSFFGGAFGGRAGMLVCHHKTKHWYFTLVNIVGMLWQAALVVFLLILRF